MFTNIVLHGDLREEFGSKFRLDVACHAEGIRALCLQLPGFLEKIQSGVYQIMRGDSPADPDGILLQHCGEDFHIIPHVVGSGAVGRIITGVLILSLVFLSPVGALISTSVAAAATGVGVALVASGITQLLSPQVESPSESIESEANPMLEGPRNVAREGIAIPLAYGTIAVGSAVVSAQLEINDGATNSFSQPLLNPGERVFDE
jgi:predicted phage tail protein